MRMLKWWISGWVIFLRHFLSVETRFLNGSRYTLARLNSRLTKFNRVKPSQMWSGRMISSHSDLTSSRKNVTQSSNYSKSSTAQTTLIKSCKWLRASARICEDSKRPSQRRQGICKSRPKKSKMTARLKFAKTGYSRNWWRRQSSTCKRLKSASVKILSSKPSWNLKRKRLSSRRQQRTLWGMKLKRKVSTTCERTMLRSTSLTLSRRDSTPSSSVIRYQINARVWRHCLIIASTSWVVAISHWW